jgi:hypothetical protein
VPLPKVDPLPAFVAGIQTVKCEECGWEGVWALPEETQSLIASIFEHLQQHGITLPTFTCQVF